MGSSTLPSVDENVEEGGLVAVHVSPHQLSVDTNGEIPKDATGRQLSTVSEQYDQGHKGWLDKTEQTMRRMDTKGQGHLDNGQVYNLIRESQKKMVTQRWLMLGLGAFAVILALANATQVLVKVFGRKRLKARKARIEKLVSGQLVGKATQAAVAAIQAAIMVATIMPAVAMRRWLLA